MDVEIELLIGQITLKHEKASEIYNCAAVKLLYNPVYTVALFFWLKQTTSHKEHQEKSVTQSHPCCAL